MNVPYNGHGSGDWDNVAFQPEYFGAFFAKRDNLLLGKIVALKNDINVIMELLS